MKNLLLGASLCAMLALASCGRKNNASSTSDTTNTGVPMADSSKMSDSSKMTDSMHSDTTGANGGKTDSVTSTGK